ncbi:MAG: Sulfurtransferase [Chlamydiia bacterium]|nr:Sulfurtransferase [Chlamydiia bacterium]MCH9615290.1 Sulfurtransferase [Chlamydiia bacterium]MCH9628388.1 Sulfurtransferase [Chlamydiia bacterium]
MKEITAKEFKENAAQYTLLDVREPEEREEQSIEPAIAIPLQELPIRFQELPTDKPIVIMCRSGGRSAQAVQFLQVQGIEALNLKGGILAYY